MKCLLALALAVDAVNVVNISVPWLIVGGILGFMVVVFVFSCPKLKLRKKWVPRSQ